MNPAAASFARRSVEVGDLAAMSMVDLDDLYRAATAPERMADLEPATDGRLLAVRGASSLSDLAMPRGWLADAALRHAPLWQGKRFCASGERAGVGVNRFRLAGARTALPFRCSYGPSLIDGQPCVVLDYNTHDTPRLLRGMRDELRAVSPGVFFGPIAMRWLGQPRLLGYFAVAAPTS